MDFKFDHLHVRCRDLEVAVEFYRRLFGAREIARLSAGDMPIVKLELGGLILSLSPARQGEVPGPVAEGERLGAYEIGLLVDDAFAAHRELCLKGAEYLIPPKEIRPGVVVSFVKAPDGMQVEVVHRK